MLFVEMCKLVLLRMRKNKYRRGTKMRHDSKRMVKGDDNDHDFKHFIDVDAF